MGLDDVPRCQHLKVNGTQCGSPALRRKRRCYFHEGVRVAGARAQSGQLTQHAYELPVLEDANAVQMALMQVMQMLLRGQLEVKIAGLLLYGLQTASTNLKHTKFEAEKATDVVIDCDTVEQTCINGPQWFSGDFVEPQEGERENAGLDESFPEDENEDENATPEFNSELPEQSEAGEKIEEKIASTQPVLSQLMPSHTFPAPACRKSTVKRKKPGLRNLDDEPFSLAKLLLQKMGLPTGEDTA